MSGGSKIDVHSTGWPQFSSGVFMGSGHGVRLGSPKTFSSWTCGGCSILLMI